jgi:uncharacterized protein YjbI with pentapeptide repeats
MKTKLQDLKSLYLIFKTNSQERFEKHRWYPTPDKLSSIPDETLLSLKRDIAKSILGSTFTLLGFGVFCILALESPDSLLLSEKPTVKLPFVGSQVSITGFFITGPILIFGMWVYLNILMTYHRKLREALSTREVTAVPTVAQLKHPFLRLVVTLTFYFLLPVVMLSFTYKAMAVPGIGMVMFSVTLLIGWVHLLTAVKRFKDIARTTLVVLGSAFILVAGYISWQTPQVFVRPYNLFRADLSRAFLPNKYLKDTYAARADLKGAVLVGADLRNAYFGNADLQGADLTRAKLNGAFFGWADLRNADLSDADLRGARLIHTDAREAILSSVKLQGAELTLVDFENAYLQYTKLDEARITDSYFQNANLMGASLKNVKFQARTDRYSLTKATGVLPGQLVEIRMSSLNLRQPIYDREGNIAAWQNPLDEIDPWTSLKEPDSSWEEREIISRARKKFPNHLSKEKTWGDFKYNSDEDVGGFQYEDNLNTRDTGTKWLAKPENADPSSWDELVNLAGRNAKIRRWLVNILKDPKKKKDLRLEALNILLVLKNGKAVEESYTLILDWYPAVPDDVHFKRVTVHKYLIIYALRNHHLSDQFAFETVQKAYGEGWQDFLKNIRNRKPVYLELTEDEKETTAVVRQRAALFLEMPTAQ